jgi:hypothetical protein
MKNSNFCVDHNSEDHWQPRWEMLGVLGGLTEFPACDSPRWLAVTTACLNDAMRAGRDFRVCLICEFFNNIGANGTRQFVWSRRETDVPSLVALMGGSEMWSRGAVQDPFAVAVGQIEESRPTAILRLCRARRRLPGRHMLLAAA